MDALSSVIIQICSQTNMNIKFMLMVLFSGYHRFPAKWCLLRIKNANAKNLLNSYCRLLHSQYIYDRRHLTTKKMISIFPLLINLPLCVYVATFQQYLFREYIYLSAYNIPVHAVPIRLCYIEG